MITGLPDACHMAERLLLSQTPLLHAGDRRRNQHALVLVDYHTGKLNATRYLRYMHDSLTDDQLLLASLWLFGLFFRVSHGGGVKVLRHAAAEPRCSRLSGCGVGSLLMFPTWLRLQATVQTSFPSNELYDRLARKQTRSFDQSWLEFHGTRVT